MTLRHVVTWTFAEPDPAARMRQLLEFKALLDALPPVIPEILALEVGINELYPDANWHITLVSEFADQAALERYQVHPAHKAVIEHNRGRTSGRAAVDFTVA
ncbi:Dabb family protein [Lysinibacter cavernae]|uniref:Quinol monooxygenase YgiN n=1 Tax=Lysinibacter cavernae TaxID=1640652 RepID=A0A7X5TTA4_9MICO|nr:Dabb family protein [Lysinibacter cavernae]NIH54426.1 quinol monooxygenase YgiN [Lysinibacter cavernae]